MSTDLEYFVNELITSDLKKRAGEPWPWSGNAIICGGYFCRPRVEDDSVSRTIARVYREPHADDLDLIVAIAIAKHINLRSALEDLGYPLPDLDAFCARLMARAASGAPCTNQNAYKVIGKMPRDYRLCHRLPYGEAVVHWFCHELFPTLHKARIRPREGDSCATVHGRLEPITGPFIAAQIVNCLKYVGPLRHAPDWQTFATSGPGSRPGLNLALERSPGKAPSFGWGSEAEWRARFDEINARVIQPAAARHGIELDAASAQGLLCEYSKFVKWTADGKPGRHYVPPHLRTVKTPRKRKAKPPAPILPPAPPPSAPPAPPVTYAPQPNAPTLFVDVETRSTIGIDVGAHRYAADPTTEIICVAYAVDAGPVEIWRRREPVPQVFAEAARDPRWRVVAHNAEFERAIMRHVLVPRHGFPIIPTKRWRCTMAMALAAALPGALENVAAALELPHQKDLEGRNLMLRMCRPLYVEAGTGKPVWLEDAEYIERLCQYCARDVGAERALFERLPPLSDGEQRVWRLDQRINKRGFHVDRELARAARAIAEREQKAIGDEISALTGGKITSAGQTARIIERVRENGHQIASLQKRSVSAVLAYDPDDETRRILELRREGSRASTRKFDSLFAGLDADNRLRGTMRYHAAAPGRWSGRAFQPQNLKRVEVVEDFDTAIDAVLAGDMDRIRAIGSPPTVIGDLMRSTICAAPSHTLIGGDFSAIEARVLAWIAGEQWKIANFREYDCTGDPALEPYCRTASKILRRPITPDDKAGRAVGKVAELACGYGGGVGAWRRFAPDDERDDAAILVDIKAWRAAHPATYQLWHHLERIAKRAVLARQPVAWRQLACEMIDGTLYLTLPSGRRIAYPQARLGPGKFEAPQIYFKDNARGGWADECAWYGSLTENVVQAIARDLLAAAMLRLEEAGFPVVLHVHDEIVCEVREGCADTAKFIEIMTMLPNWAAGLPIAARAWAGPRYTKD